MEQELQLWGYTKTDNPREYVKANWTIRFDTEFIEAFNNPDNESGWYFDAPIEKVDLEELLSEIDDMIY